MTLTREQIEAPEEIWIDTVRRGDGFLYVAGADLPKTEQRREVGRYIRADVAERQARLDAEADRDRLAAQLAEAEARVKVLEEWRDVVSWLDNDEKTFFDWCAGGGDPDGEFSKIGLRRETPDGKTLYRAYKATGNWEAPALAAVTPPAAQEGGE